jgi:hypothetical protein
MAEAELILDRLTWVAPLGLRFWDPVTQSLVSDGLQVTATPKVSEVYAGQPVSASPNRSGVFVFHHLPGLREAESGEGDQEYWDNIPSPKDYVIYVKDVLRRFLPFQITVHAPMKGVFQWVCAGSHPLAPLPGQPAGTVPLFSAPQRMVINGSAVLRADLVTGPNQPAAWAVLEIYSQTELLGRGLADKEGRAALFFPYPRLTELSPHQNRPPLAQETWQIDLEVFFSPSSPFPDQPDLCTLMEQAPARPLETLSPPVHLAQLPPLLFSQEIILKTQARSELWIE